MKTDISWGPDIKRQIYSLTKTEINAINSNIDIILHLCLNNIKFKHDTDCEGWYYMNAIEITDFDPTIANISTTWKDTSDNVEFTDIATIYVLANLCNELKFQISSQQENYFETENARSIFLGDDQPDFLTTVISILIKNDFVTIEE